VTISSTKKMCVFLSAMLVCFSSFGMESESPDKKILVVNMGPLFSLPKMPKVILTRNKSAALAVALPLTAAAAIHYKDDIVSVLPDISLPDKSIIKVMGTALAIPLTYMYTQRFTPEEQAKKYKRISEECEKHTLFVKTGEEENKDKINPLKLINNKFSDEVHKGCPVTIKAIREIAQLESSLINSEGILQALLSDGIATIQYRYPAELKEKNEDVDIKEDLIAVRETIKAIQEFRGIITASDQYGREKKQQARDKANELEGQKMSFANKMSALKPLLKQAVVSALLLALIFKLADAFDIKVNLESFLQLLRPLSLSVTQPVLIQPIDLTQQ
jgi:hypothetical protein